MIMRVQAIMCLTWCFSSPKIVGELDFKIN